MSSISTIFKKFIFITKAKLSSANIKNFFESLKKISKSFEISLESYFHIDFKIL